MLSLWANAEPGRGRRALTEALTGGPDPVLCGRYRERMSRRERALLARCHRPGTESPFRSAPAWLFYQQPEEPQGFREFATACPPRCRALHGTPRPTLFLQPLGFPPGDEDPDRERSRAFLAAVRGYAEAFLPGFAVRLNEPLAVADTRSPCRRDARSGRWQIHADGLLHFLKGRRAPGRSCLLGVTLADLYAGDSACFVFEKCLPTEGVAVCSLARLDPDFERRPLETGVGERPRPWPGLSAVDSAARELPMGEPWWRRRQQQQQQQQGDDEQITDQKRNQEQQELRQLDPDQQQHDHRQQDCQLQQHRRCELFDNDIQQPDKHTRQQQEQPPPQHQLTNEHEQRNQQQQQRQDAVAATGSDPTELPDRDVDADDEEEEEEEESWCRSTTPQGPWANAALVRRYSPVVVGLLQARLDPARSRDSALAGLTLPAALGGDFLLNSCKAVAHAACHLLGVAHCRWLECVMQAAGSAAAARARPPHLCPVCLHKLHHAAAFRLAPRYQCLLDWVRGQTRQEDNRHRESERERDDDTSSPAPHHDKSVGDSEQPSRNVADAESDEERPLSPAGRGHVSDAGTDRDGAPGGAAEPAGAIGSFGRWLLGCLEQLRGDDAGCGDEDRDDAANETENGEEEEEAEEEEEEADEALPDWDRTLEEMRETTRRSHARRREADAKAKEDNGGGGGSFRGFLNAQVATLRRQIKSNSSLRQMSEVRSIAEKSCKSLRAKLSASDKRALQGAPGQAAGIYRDKYRKPDQ